MEGCRKRGLRWYVIFVLALKCTLVEKGHHSGVGPKGHARYRGWEKIMGLHTKRVVARMPERSLLVHPGGNNLPKGGVLG